MSAYDAATGQVLWRTKHPSLGVRTNDMIAAQFAPAAVDRDLAYFVTNRGELACVGLIDGRPRWILDMPEQLGVFKRDAGDIVNPLPGVAVMDDLVFAVTGNGCTKWDKTANKTAPSLVACDKQTGKVRWTFHVPPERLQYSWSSPIALTVDGRPRLLLPGSDGVLYAFEPTSGKTVWTLTPPGAGQRPQRSDWARDFFVMTPLVVGHTLYGGLTYLPEWGPEPERALFALDLKLMEREPKNAVVWKFSDKEFGGAVASPAASGDRLYVLGQDDVLFALNRATGTVLWRSRLESGTSTDLTSPLVADGRVYVPSLNELIVFEDADVKKCVGRFQFGSRFVGQPVAGKGTIFASTWKGPIALRAK
jgi:outer membrane protein assembly factor BamB